jgi:hypothetical protein
MGMVPAWQWLWAEGARSPQPPELSQGSTPKQRSLMPTQTTPHVVCQTPTPKRTFATTPSQRNGLQLSEALAMMLDELSLHGWAGVNQLGTTVDLVIRASSDDA